MSGCKNKDVKVDRMRGKSERKGMETENEKKQSKKRINSRGIDGC